MRQYAVNSDQFSNNTLNIYTYYVYLKCTHNSLNYYKTNLAGYFLELCLIVNGNNKLTSKLTVQTARVPKIYEHATMSLTRRISW